LVNGNEMKKYIIMVFIAVIIFIVMGTKWYYLRVGGKSMTHYKEGQYCESLKYEKFLTLFSKSMTVFYGRFYSRGLCVEQNISEAKKYYLNLISTKELGEQFFYDAIETFQENQRFKKTVQLEIINKLFGEAKRLGYIPRNKEKGTLDRLSLTEVFDNSQ